MIATVTDAADFWMFDALVGEVRVPAGNLAKSLDTAVVKDHFTKEKIGYGIRPLNIA